MISVTAVFNFSYLSLSSVRAWYAVCHLSWQSGLRPRFRKCLSATKHQPTGRANAFGGSPERRQRETFSPRMRKQLSQKHSLWSKRKNPDKIALHGYAAVLWPFGLNRKFKVSLEQYSRFPYLWVSPSRRWNVWQWLKFHSFDWTPRERFLKRRLRREAAATTAEI